MRTLPTFAAVLLIGLLTSVPDAQDTLVVHDYSVVRPLRNWHLFEISAGGATLQTLGTFSPHLVLRDAVMAEDNLTYRVIGGALNSLATNAIIDVSPNGLMTTVATFPLQRSPLDLIRTSEGDWWMPTLDIQSGLAYRFLRIDDQGVATTTGAATSLPIVSGFTMIPETGLLLARVRNGVRQPLDRSYVTIDPRTGTHTRIHDLTTSAFDSLHGARDPIYDHETAEIIDVLERGQHPLLTMEMIRARPGTLRVVSPGLMNQEVLGFTEASGRSFPARFHLLTRAYGAPASAAVLQLRADGRAVGGGPLGTLVPWEFSAFLRKGSRHLTWFLTAPPNGRILKLDFPGEGGRNYVVGFSLTGVRPGPLLPDGRRIPLAVDALTVATVNGGLGPVITNTVGHLDAKGRAAVRVDTNGFGPALRGLVAWAVAIVLDPQSSAGVARIAGPERLEIVR